MAVERADVCILMLDATEGVTDQDAKIAGEAHEAGKGIIIVVNKWDEYEKENGTLEKYKKDVYNIKNNAANVGAYSKCRNFVSTNHQ